MSESARRQYRKFSAQQKMGSFEASQLLDGFVAGEAGGAALCL